MSQNFDNMYDMIIVGGGPAGLSAAIYMARAKYKTLVIEKDTFGGQITITSEVVNYPGVFRTSGKALTADMQKQAEAFGADFKKAEVLDVNLDGDIKTVKTSVGEFQTLGVILAVGAAPRQVGFEGENDFRGRGVAYCATCDGEFFTDMPVYVVGGGFAAVEEGIFLTKYASKVEMLVREEDFTCAKTVSDHVYHNEKIKVHFETEVVAVKGENSVTTIQIRNNKTGEVREESHPDGCGVFVFAGYVPNTKWLGDKVETDRGYLVTDITKKTNIDGVYGAGDVCIKELRQVVTAVSDGATAATSAEKHVSVMHTKLDIPAFEVATRNVKPTEKKEVESSNDDGFITSDMKEQLVPIFAKFTNPVTVRAVVDDSELGREMAGFITELQGISPNVLTETATAGKYEVGAHLELVRHNGASSGVRFFAMPGGHEFNSFILALYNVAGPGKELLPEDKARIDKVNKGMDIKVMISLSCTMCPEVVVASQQIASLNPNITASAIDINHFPEMKDEYKVMSVPCMIINDTEVHFGKKNLSQILDALEQA